MTNHQNCKPFTKAEWNYLSNLFGAIVDGGMSDEPDYKMAKKVSDKIWKMKP